MQFFELLGKTTGFNGGDHKIDVSVIGTNRVWSIDQASFLMLTGRAKFFYNGELVTGLDKIPENLRRNLRRRHYTGFEFP